MFPGLDSFEIRFEGPYYYIYEKEEFESFGTMFLKGMAVQIF